MTLTGTDMFVAVVAAFAIGIGIGTCGEEPPSGPIHAAMHARACRAELLNAATPRDTLAVIRKDAWCLTASEEK